MVSSVSSNAFGPLVQAALDHGARIVEIEGPNGTWFDSTCHFPGSSVSKDSVQNSERAWSSSGFIIFKFNEDKAKVPHSHEMTPDKLFWALMVGREAKAVEKFGGHIEELQDRRVLLYNLADNALAKVIKPADASRYFSEGRRRIKGKIFKRLGRWFNCPGLLLSLTFDPEKINREDAWEQVGKLRREFMNRVNRWRKRHGMPKAKCLSVIEEQHGSGYPHVHLVFPNMRWLAPVDWMTGQWNQGPTAVDYKAKDSLSPVSYVCKYISKLDGWSARALSYIWLNRTRLYSMSRDYVMPDYSDKRVPEWHFGASESKWSLLAGMPLYRLRYHTILGGEDST